MNTLPKELKQSAMHKIYEMKSKWKMASGKMELKLAHKKYAHCIGERCTVPHREMMQNRRGPTNETKHRK